MWPECIVIIIIIIIIIIINIITTTHIVIVSIIHITDSLKVTMWKWLYVGCIY